MTADAESARTDEGGAPAWFHELVAAGAALRRLVDAQVDLLGAELRVARSAARLALLALFGVAMLVLALGLTALALLAALLAQWLGSWTWALATLALVQLLLLVAAWRLFRRCLHWMSLPATRAEWRQLATTARPASPDRDDDNGPA